MKKIERINAIILIAFMELVFLYGIFSVSFLPFRCECNNKNATANKKIAYCGYCYNNILLNNKCYNEKSKCKICEIFKTITKRNAVETQMNNGTQIIHISVSNIFPIAFNFIVPTINLLTFDYIKDFASLHNYIDYGRAIPIYGRDILLSISILLI